MLPGSNSLLSRAQVLILHRLDAVALDTLLKRGEAIEERPLPLDDEARAALVASADGDGRFLLNQAETLFSVNLDAPLDPAGLSALLQRRMAVYDKDREGHYNLISALHKILRGSDPQAALYYLARMLVAGEEPLYVLRRITRFASEDIGLADPQVFFPGNRKLGHGGLGVADRNRGGGLVNGQLQHLLQLFTIARRHEHHSRDAAHEGDVKDAVMGPAVLPGQSRPVEAEDKRVFLDTDIVDQLVVGPLGKGRVDGKDRAHAAKGQAGPEAGTMLFANADIKIAIREFFCKFEQPCPVGHARGDGADPAIFAAERDNRLFENI